MRLLRLLSPFVMLCMVGLVARLGYQMARSPVLPRFAQDLGAAPELVGLIVGASTITGVFIKLPAGALSDVLGRRRVLVLGAAFFAFPPFLYPFVYTPEALLLLRFLHGASTAIFSPVASAAVADLFKQWRGERLGWFASANEVGSALGPVIGGAVLFASASYTVTYLLVGALGVLAFLLAVVLPIGAQNSRGSPTAPTAQISPRVSRRRQFMTGVKEAALDRAILVASSAEAVMFLGAGALIGFLPLYAKSVGLNEGQVGLILGVQLVTAMAGKPLTGRLSDRLGRKVMIVGGLVLCAVALPVMPLLTSVTGLMADAAVFGLGMALVTPSTTALITDLCKAGNYGAALGVFGTIWDTGEALGPILAGVLIGRLSYGLTYAIIGVAVLAAALSFGFLVRDPTARRRTDPA